MPQADTTIGELFTARREPSWQRINGVHRFDGKAVPSVTSVYHDLGLDFEVVTADMYVEVGGHKVAVTDRKAIVREGFPAANGHEARLPEVFGITGNRYKPLQNREIAALLDPLLENWTLDAVATMNKGRDLLTMFKADPFEVNGEPHQEYFGVREGKTGTDSLEFFLAPLRLFCTNQLITGMQSASFSAGIHHSPGVHGEASFTINVFQLLEEARRKLKLSFEQMGQTPLTLEQIHEFIEQVFPEPSMPARVRVLQTLAAASSASGGDLDAEIKARIDQSQIDAMATAQTVYESNVAKIPVLRQDALSILTDFNDKHTALANTPWAIYNSVVELMDFGGEEKHQDSIARSSLFGDRANVKIRAFSLAMDHVDPTWNRAKQYQGVALRPRRPRNATVTTAPDLTPEEREEQYQAQVLARHQKAADRHNAMVAEGKRPPTLETDGSLHLMTAQEHLIQTQEAEKARVARLETALANAKKTQELASMSVAERIRLRQEATANRIAARASSQAELDQAHANAASSDGGALPASGDTEDDDDEDLEDEDTDDEDE